MDRRQFLERLIMGLEEGIARTRFELPYYKPGEIEGYYAEKFLKAMEENLAKSKEELAGLEKGLTD
ncbi:MAG: hypothetical protein HY554_12325 [Elusimicrobia bacterium]|nr:hypothetical protein [Elusimicrobiota bacterium]